MRRAEAPFTIQMIVSLGLLFVVCASIAGLIMYHINIPADDKKARADMFVERVLSREGILFIDPITDRVKVNVVDVSRLAHLNGSDMGYAGTLSARIAVLDQHYFVDQNKFNREWPLLQAGFDRDKLARQMSGAGLDVPLSLPKGAFRYKFPVDVKSSNTIQKEVMEILVVVSSE